MRYTCHHDAFPGSNDEDEQANEAHGHVRPGPAPRSDGG